jgi:hypothetical protein
MSFGDRRLDESCDRYITGNYGEDQVAEEVEIPEETIIFLWKKAIRQYANKKSPEFQMKGGKK